MSDIKLAGAAWSFVGTSLAESADIWRALGIGAMDLIAVTGMGMDPAAIDRDPRGQAELAAAPGLELSNLLYLFGEDFQDRAINSADPEVRARNTATLGNVLDFCVTARIPSLLVLPGVDQPGMSHRESLELSAQVLTEMSASAAEAGVLLVFEPHIDSHLEDPAETLAFLQQNPHLRIALDYAHFIAQGYKAADVDLLVPYAGHFHLRQGADKQLQARWDDGEIDFTAVVGKLKEAGYQGYLTLEYEHEPGWMDMDRCDVITESIKMRDLVRPLLS